MSLEFLKEYDIPTKFEIYHLKKLNLGNGIFRYLYSKGGSFLIPETYNTTEHTEEELKSLFYEYSNIVFYEVYGPQNYVEAKIREYFYLLRFHNKYYKRYMGLMGFNSVYVVNQPDNNEIIGFKKTFDLMAHLDVETNSIFYSVISPEFERDFINILQKLIDLNNSEMNCFGLQFQTEDINTETIEKRNVVQVLNLSCPKEQMKQIREFYEKNKWKIILLNEEKIKDLTDKDIKLKDTIILCEGKNKKLFDLVGLDNFWFSDQLNSLSLYDKVKTKELSVLRDKDFLTKGEVIKFRQKYPKFHILDFYCIENYLYHPDNLKEILGRNFDKKEYIKHIIKCKNEKPSGLNKIINSRKTYNEFKDNNFKKEEGAEKLIFDSLKSDEFDVFYEFYSMKKLDKSFMNKLKLRENQLAQTNWFKDKLAEILNKR